MSLGEPSTLLDLPAFRRLLVASALVHVAAGAGLAFSPTWSGREVQPLPVFVEIVAPTPPPPPARRVRQEVKEVVIPKQPVAKPKAVPKPAPPPPPEPEPPQAKPEPAPAEPAPPSVEDLFDQLRRQVQAEDAQRPARAAAAPRGRIDPELAAYHKRVKALLYANWAGGRLFRTQGPLLAHFQVDLDATGGVRSLRLTRSSGNRHFDESAERAILKVQPFPPPPRGALTMTVTFDPREAV